jgi:hypothetical protein
MTRGKPAHRSRLMNDDDLAIIVAYGSEYRGVVQYYLLAGDVWRLNRLRWAAETSLLKTLAAKHRSTVTKMAAAYGTVIVTPPVPAGASKPASTAVRAGKPLVARFGGIPLKRQRKAVLTDRQPPPAAIHRKELIRRLLAGRCEMCGHDPGPAEVHQVRRLADLATPGQPNPDGRKSWPDDGARPSWSAKPATTPSTPGNPPHCSRNSHRKATCGESRMRSFGGGRWKRTCPSRHLASVLPHSLSRRAGVVQVAVVSRCRRLGRSAV